MLNAMAKPTMPQIPDFPDVMTQALSGPSTATLPHAGSAKDTISDDIWTNSHHPPLVASFTAPAVPDRPPAAPDPITDVTLPTTAALHDCMPVIVTLLETHATYDCTPHSEMQLSHPPDGDVQPAPVIGDCANPPGHVTLSVSTIVTM